jgi:uncharacterized protein YcbK (DUF882 family)
MPKGAFAQPLAPRVLRFDHLHTGEKLAIEYWKGGAYESEGLGAINRLMRDFRTGDVHPIDPSLLDLLHDLAETTGTRRPFEIISAYRSPATNATLHSHSDGVASKSLHLKGKAIDVRLADVPLHQLRRAALNSRRGGVGYYPASNFVHVDTGRVRTW